MGARRAQFGIRNPETLSPLFLTIMLGELLVRKRSAIVDRWVKNVFDSYPSSSVDFLKSQKDQFANPVGHTISRTAEKVFDELVGSCDAERIRSALSDLVKMRAVQEFSPSQAIGFVFDLKTVIRGEVRKEGEEKMNYEGLAELDSKIDAIALIAFDLYMESREKLFRIRLEELKAKSLHETLQKILQNRAP